MDGLRLSAVTSQPVETPARASRHHDHPSYGVAAGCEHRACCVGITNLHYVLACISVALFQYKNHEHLFDVLPIILYHTR